MPRPHALLAVASAAVALAICTQWASASFAAPAVLDVDSPTHNDTAFQHTMRCVFADDDYQACDSNSVSIKYIMWRLLERGCNSCTDDELKVFRFMAYLSNNRSSEWQQVLNKYDPQGELKTKNAALWKQYGVAV